MKLETRLKKVLEIKDENIRLAKLEGICLRAIPYSAIWEEARAEAKKLRKAGAKYW